MIYKPKHSFLNSIPSLQSSSESNDQTTNGIFFLLSSQKLKQNYNLHFPEKEFSRFEFGLEDERYFVKSIPVLTLKTSDCVTNHIKEKKRTLPDPLSLEMLRALLVNKKP